MGVVFLSISSVATADFAGDKSIHRLKSLPYEIVVDNRQGEIKFEKDKIEITAQKGTDLFTNTTGEKNADNSPRALFTPEGDFIFSAKVAGNFADSPYDGGAIIVYSDAKYWGKLLFERFTSGKLGVATTVSKGTGDDAYHGTRETSFHYLKIVRYDSSYIFYTSQDGADWNFVRHFEFETAAPASIGFMAQSPFAESFTVTFSDIKYRSGRLTDFWQGE